MTNVRKPITLTLTLDEATQLDRYMQAMPYVSLAGLAKAIILEYVSAKNAEIEKNKKIMTTEKILKNDLV